MNGGGCGKIIFGTRHKSTDYWTVNVRKFKCKEDELMKKGGRCYGIRITN
jgi:hypothetical protein